MLLFLSLKLPQHLSSRFLCYLGHTCGMEIPQAARSLKLVRVLNPHWPKTYLVIRGRIAPGLDLTCTELLWFKPKKTRRIFLVKCLMFVLLPRQQNHWKWRWQLAWSWEMYWNLYISIQNLRSLVVSVIASDFALLSYRWQRFDRSIHGT